MGPGKRGLFRLLKFRCEMAKPGVHKVKKSEKQFRGDLKLDGPTFTAYVGLQQSAFGV